MRFSDCVKGGKQGKERQNEKENSPLYSSVSYEWRSEEKDVDYWQCCVSADNSDHLLICLLPHRDNMPIEPEEIIDDMVEPEELFEPIIEPEGMEETMAKYPNVYAWIEMPGTSAILGTKADVSYPVAQHPTQRLFYLNHDLDGNTYKPGTLYRGDRRGSCGQQPRPE